MPGAKQVIALLSGHFEGDEERVYTIALQIAAAEARQGHVKNADDLKRLVDGARARKPPKLNGPRLATTTSLLKPRADLDELVSVSDSQVHLVDMTLKESIRQRLAKLIAQQQQRARLREFGQRPSARMLLVGPPGSGKTLTASALAGELHLPLYTVRLDGVLTRFMGESATKLRMVFDQIAQQRAVYLFDEFDAIGGKRSGGNDVGEIRRVLNSFLQFLEEINATDSVIVAATNHPELLDRALVRRFDEIIEYGLPDQNAIKAMISKSLGTLLGGRLDWSRIASVAEGLSQAELARAADEAMKEAILAGKKSVTTDELLTSVSARKAMREAVADIFTD